jgi:hypothetical protein
VQVISLEQEWGGIISRHMCPENLLWMLQELYGRTPGVAYLVTVGWDSFKMEARLSDTVRNSAPGVLTMVERIVYSAKGERWNLPGSRLRFRTPPN